ncbi:MAG: hypothetical protein JST00_45800 [Deltaproteobacteria bacterium]|nr:hypothetical protein [Deltaproteobacteria bacterium]
MRSVVSLLLVVVTVCGIAVACGGATAGSADGTDAGASPTGPTVDLDCPGPGNYRRKPHPSGACDAGAVCEFKDPPGKCKPNDLLYPPQKDWRCTCESGTWACVSYGGALGVEFCDAGADVDASTSADASDGGADAD